MSGERPHLSEFVFSPDVEFIDDDESLDENPITLPSGRVLDEAGAEAYGREVADRAAARRAQESRD